MFDEVLEKIFYDPANPGSFSSVQKLFNEAKKEAPKIKLKHVKEFLQRQKTYTLHFPRKNLFKRRKTVVRGINDQFQGDLIILNKYSRQNSGIKNILCVIDVFSRFAFVRGLKNKSGNEVAAKLDEIFQLRKPKYFQTDNGTEFYNVHVQTLLTKLKITHFSTSSDTKSSLVERFIRTFKNRLFKYLTSKNTFRYIDNLQDFVNGYNRAKHRSLGVAPVDVTPKNEREIWLKLYKNEFPKKASFKFKIGDKIRLQKAKKTFGKSYEAQWTDEIFIIHEQFATNPVIYKVKDMKGDILEGSYYEKEIQKVENNNDV